MATNNVLNNSLADATAKSITFNPSVNGIIGTTTNDNANAGYVGEFISSVIPFVSPVSITDSTNTNLTSVSLGAGDWDVYANILFFGTTFDGGISGWTSLISADVSEIGTIMSIEAVVGQPSGFPVPTLRYSLSAPATVYLVGVCSFTTGSASMCGGIYARRAR